MATPASASALPVVTITSDVALLDDSGCSHPFSSLAESYNRLYLHGVSNLSERVCSDAVVRYYVEYGSRPMLIVQTIAARYCVPVAGNSAGERYTEHWTPLVRSVTLAAAVLSAARRGCRDVWATAAPHLSVDEQLAQWSFVREVLDSLGALHSVRSPSEEAQQTRKRSWDEAEGAHSRQQRLMRGGKAGSGGSVASGAGGPDGGGLVDIDSSLGEMLLPGEVMEVQQMRCRTPRYAHVQRCRSCSTSRNEQCRFRYMRRLATRQGQVVRPLGSFEQGSGFRLNTTGAGSGGGSGGASGGGAGNAPDGGGNGGVSGAAAAKHARYLLCHVAAPFEEIVSQELALTAGEEVMRTALALSTPRPGASTPGPCPLLTVHASALTLALAPAFALTGHYRERQGARCAAQDGGVAARLFQGRRRAAALRLVRDDALPPLPRLPPLRLRGLRALRGRVEGGRAPRRRAAPVPTRRLRLAGALEGELSPELDLPDRDLPRS